MADYAKTGFSRIFLIEGEARPDHAPVYQLCMKPGGVSREFGDIVSVYAPNLTRYNQLVEIDSYRGLPERAVTSLMGRYLADVKSKLLHIASRGCSADIHINFGKCTDPTIHNTFTKSIILEGAYINSFSTDGIVALSPDERNFINEAAEISARSIYEVVDIYLVEVTGLTTTSEIVDVTICDATSCGCSAKCQHIYAITKIGGSGELPRILHTIDRKTWYTDDIDSLTNIQNPSALACLGNYIYVVSNDAGSVSYALLDEVNTPSYDATWTEIAVVGAPNDCFHAPGGRYLYICGDGGYIYRINNPTSGVIVLNAATTENLNAIMMYNDEVGVAVGNDGVVVHTVNGTTWASATIPVGADLTCVWCINDSTWFVGTSDGTLYYTVDKGITWELKNFPGSGTGTVHDIAFPSNSIGYLSHTTTLGNVLCTSDGGYSWNILPKGNGTIPLNDRLNAIAVCPSDKNFLVAVGLDGTNGTIIYNPERGEMEVGAIWPSTYWWLTTGVTNADVVFVYQPLHASSLNDSYTNLALYGTRDATVVTPPTLDAEGWVFDGVGQYVISGLPAGLVVADSSMVIRFSDFATVNGYIFGNGQFNYGLKPNNATTDVAWILVGLASNYAPELLVGTLGHAGKRPYRNGLTEPSPWIWDVTTVGQTYIAARQNAGVAEVFCNCKIQGIVWYNKVLTAVQMLAVMSQVAAI